MLHTSVLIFSHGKLNSEPFTACEDGKMVYLWLFKRTVCNVLLNPFLLLQE